MFRYSPGWLTLALLSGCSLIPDYQRPAPPVPETYAQGSAVLSTGEARQYGWRQVFRDPALVQLLDTAMTHNRDLRVALLNIQAFQAQYRIQRSALFPSVSIQGSGTRQSVPADLSTSGVRSTAGNYSVGLGISAYELDLFGRNRSLSQEKIEAYLAQEQAQRSTRLSLIGNVATAYLSWRADQEQLALARQTLEAYEKSLSLTTQQLSAGGATALAQSQASTQVESARARVAQYQRQVDQGQNNLQLLTGAPVQISVPSEPISDDLIAQMPAGLPSQLLQRRPDILQAEHQLKAANANIGAARAAFFPSITLTANGGTASSELSGLFKAGSKAWTFQPQINIPLFNAGNLRASLDYAKIQKDIDVAQYEKSIQTAFQEVSDGLAARQTYRQQVMAQHNLVKASENYYRLAESRYREGLDSSLTFLDAQRSLYSAQSSLINDRLSQLTAEVNLYKALGGDWQQEPSQEL